MLGLGHGGSDDINGKPNYFSLMNYLFGPGWDYKLEIPRPAQFSHGEYSTLRPGEVCEQNGLQNADLTHLDAVTGRRHKLNIDRQNGWIDWNLDGIYSPCERPVRTAPMFADYDSDVNLIYPFSHGGQFLGGLVPRVGGD